MYDTMRILSMAAVAVAVVLAIALIARPYSAVGQRVRLVSQAGLALIVASIEVEHFGDYANLRLVFVVLVTSAAAWGNFLAVRYEKRGTNA